MGKARSVALAVVSVAAALSSAAGAGGTAGATVKVAFNAKLHASILVNASGLTLYAYIPDAVGRPTCLNDATYHCSKAWPPLRTTGAPRAGRGVKPALLSSVRNPEGGRQVTYNRHPLYTDAGAARFGLKADAKRGDANGQGFVGVWYVVSPSGKLIRR